MKKLLLLSIVLSGLIIPATAFPLPDTQQGLSIGGMVVESTTGIPVYNLNEVIPTQYTGLISPGEFFTCFTDFLLQTGSTTNSFFNDLDLSVCPALDGVEGSLDLFGGISTTLFEDTSATNVVEIMRFSRSAPNAPIAIRFEPFGIAHADVIVVTPSILDQNANVLFTGSTVSAIPNGVGPVGSTAFDVVLDNVPDEVVAANVTRILQLSILGSGVGADVVQFQLTYLSSGGCIELIHIGPAEPAPMATSSSFGCPSQIPPSNCLDKTSESIATSRAYQKATRTVGSECGRKMSTECSAALQQQVTTYNQLGQVQQEVELLCDN